MPSYPRTRLPRFPRCSFLSPFVRSGCRAEHPRTELLGTSWHHPGFDRTRGSQSWKRSMVGAAGGMGSWSEIGSDFKAIGRPCTKKVHGQISGRATRVVWLFHWIFGGRSRTMAGSGLAFVCLGEVTLALHLSVARHNLIRRWIPRLKRLYWNGARVPSSTPIQFGRSNNLRPAYRSAALVQARTD